MNELISIVIPAYNAAAFISKTLDTILNQTYKNFEVVVINDGSKDNTLDILKEYEKTDSRIRVFPKKTEAFRLQEILRLQKLKVSI